jgi:rhomboid family protein
VIPLSDEPRPEGFTPFVGYGLILLNIVAYGVTTAQVDGWEERSELFLRWGFAPAEFDLLTLVTSMFIHANPLHLLGNMLFLWIFCVNVEWCLGRVGFLAAYLLTGIAGSLAYWAASADPEIPVVGASGAISGILGIYLVAFPTNRIRVVWLFFGGGTGGTVPAWLAMVVWFGWHDAVPLMTGSGSDDGVAHWAHLGAFAAGVGLSFVLKGWIAAREGREGAAEAQAVAGTWEKYLKR